MTDRTGVVLQGEIHPAINDVVESIRSWFTGELVLSTWDRGSRPSIPGVDKILFLGDPGPGPVQNIRRQIVGLREALSVITADVVFKTRSDMIHRRDMFSFFKHQKSYDRTLSVFSERVVISSVMTMNHDSPPEYRPLSPSDWFYVGNKTDIEKYCDILDVLDRYSGGGLCCEQLWFFSALSKCGVVSSDSFKIKSISSEMLWRLLLNNFVVVDTNRSADAVCLKYQGNYDNNDIYMNEKVFDDKAKEEYGS